MRIQVCVASISSQGFYCALGLPTIGPGARIHQAQHNEGLSCQFLPLQLPPSPYGPSCLSGRINRVTVQYSWGWRFKVLGVDDSQRGRRELQSLLTGCQAIMRYDTCHFFIGFSPGLKCRFVFRAFHIYIYIYHTSPLSFLHFSTKTYCQSAIVNLVRERSVKYLYLSSIQSSSFSYLDLVSIFFS